MEGVATPTWFSRPIMRRLYSEPGPGARSPGVTSRSVLGDVAGDEGHAAAGILHAPVRPLERLDEAHPPVGVLARLLGIARGVEVHQLDMGSVGQRHLGAVGSETDPELLVPAAEHDEGRVARC